MRITRSSSYGEGGGSVRGVSLTETPLDRLLPWRETPPRNMGPETETPPKGTWDHAARQEMTSYTDLVIRYKQGPAYLHQWKHAI